MMIMIGICYLATLTTIWLLPLFASLYSSSSCSSSTLSTSGAGDAQADADADDGSTTPSRGIYVSGRERRERREVEETPSSFLPHINSSVSILHHHSHHHQSHHQSRSQHGQSDSHHHLQNSHSFWSQFPLNPHSTNTTTNGSRRRSFSRILNLESQSQSQSQVLFVARFLSGFLAIGTSCHTYVI